MQGLRLYESGFAEGRILGHGEIVRRDLSAQDFEPQVAQRNLSAERPRKLRLERGPELIHVNQKRHADYNQYQDREEDSSPLCNAFHRHLQCSYANVLKGAEGFAGQGTPRFPSARRISIVFLWLTRNGTMIDHARLGI